MRRVHLENVNLNLLTPLYALLEEKSVTRAAARVHLSQPAMSRSLERLRAIFQDDLLNRGSRNQYKLTPKAIIIKQELLPIMQSLGMLWNRPTFSPANSAGRIRTVMNDFVADMLLPQFQVNLQNQAPQLKLEISSWHANSYDELLSGVVDLVLSPFAPPPVFCSQKLFTDTFICLVSAAHSFRGKRFTWQTYLKQRHLAIEIEPGEQNLLDGPLTNAGVTRPVFVRMPSLRQVAAVLAHTELVLTAPLLIAKDIVEHYPIRSVEAPKGLPSLMFSQVWHPRLDRDPLHVWFRSLLRENLHSIRENTARGFKA